MSSPGEYALDKIKLEGYEDDLASEPLQTGFASSTHKNSGSGKRHTHEFGPISKEWYRKRNNEDVFYAMLLCACGVTKEIMAEDRTQPDKVPPKPKEV